MKRAIESKTIAFFGLVLAAGGLDILSNLVNEESITWRSVAIAVLALVAIGLRLVTKDAIVK